MDDIMDMEGLLNEYELYDAVRGFVQDYMNRYDASHDFNHIERVLANAKHILRRELEMNPRLQVQADIITFAALLHDVGDRKYIRPGEDTEQQITKILMSCGASLAFAQKVEMICKNVSYSNETKHPEQVKKLVEQNPELAIVQDADRLDAIGAIGIGRTFTYGGAKGGRGMQDTVDHFTEKLEKLERMMKTRSGKEIARKRTDRLKMFRSWWEEELEESTSHEG